MATPQGDPLAYSAAFKESEFILKQAMKAGIAKQGARTDEELLSFQTDLVRIGGLTGQTGQIGQTGHGQNRTSYRHRVPP